MTATPPCYQKPLVAPATPEVADDQASVVSTTSVGSSSHSSDVGVPSPPSAAAAAREVPSLLSQLVSGHSDEQALAARKLFKYCRSGGPAVQRAVVDAKGVHMLLIMLDSLDPTVRDLCTRTLTDLAAAEECVRADIAAAPGGVGKVVAAMVRGVVEGQASAGAFLELLAGSSQEAVKAACCHGKVVRTLTKALGSAQSPKVVGSALEALRAFCRDPSNVSKMVWTGGVPALVTVLQAGDAEQALPALELLALSARALPDSVTAACTARGVEALSQHIGSSEAELQAQALAAEVLSAIAALPRKREDAAAALADHALPRACEVVRSLQADHDTAAAACPQALAETSGQDSPRDGPERQEERALLGACAAVVAHLAQGSPDCARVVVYHTASLRATVAALVATRQCGLAQSLLQALLLLATSCGGDRESGHEAALPVMAAAAAAEE